MVPMKRSTSSSSSLTKKKSKRTKVSPRLKLYSLIETKDRYFTQTMVNTSGIPKFYNPLYYFATGAQPDRKVGQKIFLQGFEFRFAFNLANPNINDLVIRLTVVKSTDKLPTGLVSEGFTNGTSALLNGDVSVYNTQATNYDVAIVDREVCTPLLDRTYTITSQASDTVGRKSMNAYIPINREFVYSSNETGYGKFYNYYFVLTMVQNNTTVGIQTIGNTDFTIRTVFKDA